MKQLMIPELETQAPAKARQAWPLVKLGEVLEKIEAGVSPNTLSRPAEAHELGVLKVSAVTWSKFRADQNKALPYDFNATGYHRVKKGDLILSRANTADLLASPVVVEKDYPNLLLSDKTLRLIPKNDFTFEKFLYYLLKTKAARIFFKSHSTGTSGSMSNVSQATIRSFKFPLPPLAEQQRIVARLDLAQRLIDQRKAQLALMDQLVQSLFYEMFGDPVKNEMGWEVRPLGEILTIVRGGSPRPIEKYLGGEYPWIKIGDATQGDDIYLHATKESIIKEGLSKTRLLPAGSVIFANCGVSLGFARIITFEGCIHDGWLALSDINPNQLDKIFLLKTLNSITQYFRDIAPDGTQPNLNTAIMKNHLMIIPPLPLQQTFADRVQQIEALKQQMQVSLAELEQGFQALMQEAFGH